MLKISLTNFLTFNSKVSMSAKRKYIADFKSSEYFPGMDYWKDLRSGIQQVALGKIDPVDLIELSEGMSDSKSKRTNYLHNAKKFIGFVKNKNIKYFSVGSAAWTLDDKISINASPEIGMEIDDIKYCVKIYYKKPKSDTKVNLRNTAATLTLMKAATKNFDDTDCKYAVLNLQNGRFLTSVSNSADDIVDLELEAENYLNIWNHI